MNSILDAAAYISYRYSTLTGEDLDELKLHQLLYLLQREALAVLAQPAFEGDFEGWDCGPVSPEVMKNTKDGKLVVSAQPLSSEIVTIADNVIENYGIYAVWHLKDVLRAETSWEKSREGLEPGEKGSRILSMRDIWKDAKEVRPYDPVSGMYYDEMEDIPPEELDMPEEFWKWAKDFEKRSKEFVKRMEEEQ